MRKICEITLTCKIITAISRLRIRHYVYTHYVSNSSNSWTLAYVMLLATLFEVDQFTEIRRPYIGFSSYHEHVHCLSQVVNNKLRTVL